VGADRKARVSRLLDEVGLGAERRLQLRRFSKGMVQRVGIAQALLNDPEVVFLDEPMSGLDPLGRRDMRALVLRLRDEGRTVFFSSHILSDAEALCSRVAILAGGRLAASGRLTDLLAYEIRGWELVVAGLPAEALRQAVPDAVRLTALDERRVTMELSKEAEPARVAGQIAAAGGTLVSLNPLHTTLEEIFVRQVQATESARAEALR
jgi:ABC-2 type transport system ATP-binding protein